MDWPEFETEKEKCLGIVYVITDNEEVVQKGIILRINNLAWIESHEGSRNLTT